MFLAQVFFPLMSTLDPEHPHPTPAVLIKAQRHEIEQNNNIAEVLCGEESAAESSSPALLLHLFVQANESPYTLSDPASPVIILIRNGLDFCVL